MNNYKKVLAGILATSMIVGNSVVAFADEGRIKGSGEMEGSVLQEVFSVVLPTVADNDDRFNYVMDPLELIQEATNNKYAGYDFEAGKRVYFYKGVDSTTGDLQYDDVSQTLKVENRSSDSVDLTVTLKVSGVDGIALTGDNTFAGATDPSMYFGLIDTATTPNKYAIDSNGIATHTETLTKLTATESDGTTVTDAHIIQWNPIRNAYEFVENTAPGTIFTAPSYEFGITADCNLGGDDKWLKILEAGVSPELEVIWGIQNPFEATIALAQNGTDNTKTDLTISNLTSLKNFQSISINNGTETLAVPNSDASVEWKLDNWDATSGGEAVVTLNKDWTDWMTGKLVTITLTLTDSSVKTVTIQAP
jgi:hypothetical protein